MSKNESKKVLVLYHAECIDGFTSAWVCHKGLTEKEGISPSDITFMPAEYHKVQDIVEICKPYAKVFIVDFSVTPDVLVEIAKFSSVEMLDHHAGAMEMYRTTYKEKEITKYQSHARKGAYVIIDLTECGASLCWQRFFGEPLPNLIKYVKDSDLWAGKYEESRYISTYTNQLDKTFDTWDCLYMELEELWTRREILEKGKLLHNYFQRTAKSLASNATHISLAGHEGLVVNAPRMFRSAIGNILAERSGTYGATWEQIGNEARFSLRSVKREGCFDVNELAKNFGGKGHINAAGFVLTEPAGESSIFPDSDSPASMKLWRI